MPWQSPAVPAVPPLPQLLFVPAPANIWLQPYSGPSAELPSQTLPEFQALRNQKDNKMIVILSHYVLW